MEALTIQEPSIPTLSDQLENSHGDPASQNVSTTSTSTSTKPPRLLIIGAGVRGNAYAKAVSESSDGVIAAIAEPIPLKRRQLGSTYIWGASRPEEGQEFRDWKEFIKYEWERRAKASNGLQVPEGVDGVFVCTLDHQHREIICALAPLGLHIMSEKPLATTLDDCIEIYSTLRPKQGALSSIFAIGHVLRYSPHNMLLRKLLVEEEAIGEILSMEHTEPVGWWHFSHSYVRGNWRKESTTAPSLLTKSCHDIDLLLWLFCSPPAGSNRQPHLPSSIVSTGSLKYFKNSRKPLHAGNATNCLSCPAEKDCLYSAKKLYHDKSLMDWGVNNDFFFPAAVVIPEIEDCFKLEGVQKASSLLLGALKEDYDETTPTSEVESRSWYGRCVYEADNDVCDDQLVTMTWEDDPLPTSSEDRVAKAEALKGRGAKTALFHMVAFTEKICERRSIIYGTKGEIHADSTTIKVYDFASGKTAIHNPPQMGGGHGGGDSGLASQFVKAIDSVKNRGMAVLEAQQAHIGCSLEDIIRSHAMVFAAETARKGKTVIDWESWWENEVESRIRNTTLKGV